MTDAEQLSSAIAGGSLIISIIALVTALIASRKANSIALRSHISERLEPYRKQYTATRAWFNEWQDTIGRAAETASDNAFHSVDQFDKGDESGRPLRHILGDIAEGFHNMVKGQRQPIMYYSICRDLIQFPWERIKELDSPKDKTFYYLRISSSERKALFRLLAQFDSRLSDANAAWTAVKAVSEPTLKTVSVEKDRIAQAMATLDKALSDRDDPALDLEPGNEFWASLVRLRDTLHFFNEFDSVDSFLEMDFPHTKRGLIIISALMLYALTEGIDISRNAWGIPED